jgi:hypothetical protein
MVTVKGTVPSVTGLGSRNIPLPSVMVGVAEVLYTIPLAAMAVPPSKGITQPLRAEVDERTVGLTVATLGATERAVLTSVPVSDTEKSSLGVKSSSYDDMLNPSGNSLLLGFAAGIHRYARA